MKSKKLIFLRLFFIAIIVSGCATAPSPLDDAIRKDDIDAVREFIDHDQSANKQMDATWGLFVATYGGHKDIAQLLIAKGANVNQMHENPDDSQVWASTDDMEGTPLLFAAKNGYKDVVELLLAKGADARIASSVYPNHVSKTPRMYAEENGHADIALLLKMAEEEGPRPIEAAVEEDPQEIARFEKAAQDYRNASLKPSLPEEAYKFKVQAEGAIRDKEFEEAAKLYGKAVDIAPWWPEGHFNRAIIFGETRHYQGAIREMKRYMTLVPDTANSRAAQDHIYDWERKVGE